MYCTRYFLRSKYLLKQINKLERRSYSTNNYISETVTFSNGRRLTLSTGDLAKLADGCAQGTMGNTTVMVTVVSKIKPGLSGNITPLTVDYRDKFASTAGLRRVFKLTDREVLVSRCIDRSLRPLFKDTFKNDTQLVCETVEHDEVYDPSVVAINAASACLSISDVPWNGPVGAVRVGLIDGQTIVNPTKHELESSILNLLVTATKQNLVVMLEGSANNVLQQELLKAIKVGVKEAQVVVNEIDKLQKAVGRTKKTIEEPVVLSDEIVEAIESLAVNRIEAIFQDREHNKTSRDVAITTLKNDVIRKVCTDFVDFERLLAENYFDKVSKRVFREIILNSEVRCDGRGLDDLRTIACDIDMYKSLHGCSIFQRGQTQVRCNVTLDAVENPIQFEPVTILTSGLKKKNFYVNYSFPPYATNEIGKIGLVGRREIGHGALAEKGLYPIVPSNYPFTIRLNADVLESNGSSSMATVCGGSLALMDAGVNISEPAAGVAVGLVTKYSNDDTKHIQDYRLLTDLLGIEDYLGDMDFKLAGTRKGITALQADIKIPGLPLKIIMEAVLKATDAKSNILDIMKRCIDKPRVNRKEKWPVVENLNIEPHKRARLFGYGNFQLKRLYYHLGVSLNQIDEKTYSIFAPDEHTMQQARKVIDDMLKSDPTEELECNEIYSAKVVEIRDTGVMITLVPNMQPVFLSNSQLDEMPVKHASALGIQVGNELKVKYYGRDKHSGQLRISRKILQKTGR